MKTAHLRRLGPTSLLTTHSFPLPKTHPRTYKVIHAKLPRIFPKKALNNSQSIQGDASVMDVAKKLTLHRISEVLNLQLVKQVTKDINKYLPARLWTQTQVAIETYDKKEQKLEQATESLSAKPREEIKDLENSELKASQIRTNAHQTIEREQHSFAEAMNFTNYASQAYKPKSTSSYSAQPTAASITPPKPARAGIVQQITNMMPQIRSSKEDKVQQEEAKHRALSRKQSLAQSSAEQKTKGLVIALRASTSDISRLRRLEELCKHLSEHPMTKNKAVKEKAIPCLLKLRDSGDLSIRGRAMEALALTGYANPVKGRGIRILSLDGGGTRGLVAIEMLRKLEEVCGQEIHQMFDYVCGVSTGALIGIMSVVYRVPLSETEQLYKSFSAEMFSRNKLMGVGKLFMSHSYYDALLWEKILQENIGFKSFLETTRDPECPKICAVSCLMNVPKLQNYMFRNYNLPVGVQSHYPGSSSYKLWEAIRASSAAPGYFEESKLDEWVHQDGGLLTNNPTAMAIHECKLLWPTSDIQCVVSLGTGKYEPTIEPKPSDPNSLKNKLTKIVQSATDTEAVHSMLNDLLPPSTYFRFNPYMSEEFELDEIRPDKWDQMKHDAQMYTRKNEHKLNRAAATLLQTKRIHQVALDWVQHQLDRRL